MQSGLRVQLENHGWVSVQGNDAGWPSALSQVVVELREVPSARPEPIICNSSFRSQPLQKAFPKGWARAPRPFPSTQPLRFSMHTVFCSSKYTPKAQQAQGQEAPRLEGKIHSFPSLTTPAPPQPQPPGPVLEGAVCKPTLSFHRERN